MRKKGHSDVGGGGKVIVVALKASKEIPKAALEWALTHVVQPDDCIKLLVVLPPDSSNTWIRGIARFTSDCTQSTQSGTLSDQKDEIVQSCSQMVFQLQKIYDSRKIRVRVKVVPGSLIGVVAAESKKAQSNWVILDKHLKNERKYCMEELQCNVVVMKRSQPKVLRLNLVNSQKVRTEVSRPFSPESEASPRCLRSYFEQSGIFNGPAITPASSPDQVSPLTATDVGTSSISSSELGTSSWFSGIYGSIRKNWGSLTDRTRNLNECNSDSDYDKPSPIKKSYFHHWMEDVYSSRNKISKHAREGSQRTKDKPWTSIHEKPLEKFSKLGLGTDNGVWHHQSDTGRSAGKSIALSRKSPAGPPPLCSICQHKAPVFGNPPRWFTYAELEVATGGFSLANFLAEGGFGSVHRGILPDGQVVAVKQYKVASSQGDREFCSEVEVLSCAQHRNVVMLIGFCVEDGKRLLVYEYICNGSLDSHLYGRHNEPLEWSSRQKIAVGAARGLRYLHEECRVGCIVHRDLRPNNILLTHDFEPLVGDFGLARWQPDGDTGVETRILGTFGYLAPEYAQSGQITEKADVYSFGVVLLELVTGRKAIDINRPKGQQCLTEWARPLLAKDIIHELVDPCLTNCYSEEDVYRMLECASLCIRQDPCSRPRMSQVLRLLEGEIFM